MHIIHFSDTHLGHQQYGRVNEHGLNQREMDHYASFQAVIDAAIAAKPDVVIHAGDLFDGVRPSNRALREAMQGFLRLSRAGIETIVIAGNHEHPKLRATGSPFALFEHIEHIHAVYKGKAEAIPIAGHNVWAVPQNHTPEALRAQMDAITPKDGDVLVLHGAVHDLEAFHHAEFNEQSLDPAWFEGFAYVALGHYHGTQQVADNAWYCGAPDRVSIRESGEPKGYLEIKKGAVQFHEIEGRPYKDLTPIDATGLDAQALDEAVTSATETIPKGAVSRLRIHNIDPSLRGALNLKEWKQTRALITEIKPEFADEERFVGGVVEFQGLAEEFTEFSAQYPIEDLDRAKLLDRAKTVLQEAQ